MNLELDASFQEEVVEHSALVKVGAAALVGDGARSVAGAPQFVVRSVQSISHAHVEREVLVTLKVVAYAWRGVKTLVVDESGAHLEAQPWGVLALVIEVVAALGIDGDERVAPVGVVLFGLGLVGALRIGLENWLEAVQTNTCSNVSPRCYGIAKRGLYEPKVVSWLTHAQRVSHVDKSTELGGIVVLLACSVVDMVYITHGNGVVNAIESGKHNLLLGPRHDNAFQRLTIAQVNGGLWHYVVGHQLCCHGKSHH